MTDASERERLIEAMRIAEALGGVCPDSGILYKISDMLRADAETIRKLDGKNRSLTTELEHARDKANRAKSATASLGGIVDQLRTQLAAQSAELDGVRKDAARYRWLRDKSEKSQCGFYLSVGEALKDIRFQPQSVDNSIDAALATPSAAGGEKEG